MWETGAAQTLRNMFEDVTRGEAELAAAGGRWDRFKERFSEWKDERLEGLARFPGGRMWGEMKQNAAALSGHAEAGVVKLFAAVQRPGDTGGVAARSPAPDRPLGGRYRAQLSSARAR